MDGPKLCLHSADVHGTWKKVQDFVNGKQVLVRGDNLDIAAVAAVDRYTAYNPENFAGAEHL